MGGSSMRFSYIFDFDGVIAKTMEPHYICYKQALEETGVPIIREQFYSQAGMTALEQIKYFCDLAGVQADYKAVYARKRELFKDYITLAEPIPCNIELIETLRRNGCKVAIASGSSSKSIMPVMEIFKLNVDAVVTSEDVKRGKPNPDLFLKAAEKLNVTPRLCIVIEDSDAGIEAARNAGMSAMRFYDKECLF
jgi:beta-phosphoglucomutase